MFQDHLHDTQFGDTDVMEFGTPDGEWILPVGWVVAAVASLGFVVLVAPSVLGMLLGVVALTASINAGFTTWRASGRVLIGDGMVRICPAREQRPEATKLEAPYSAFRKVRVSRRKSHGGNVAMVRVDLLHDIPNRPAIGLYAEPCAYLPYEDRSLINRLAARLNIPIDETHWNGPGCLKGCHEGGSWQDEI
jgi:hypothetical protein